MGVFFAHGLLFASWAAHIPLVKAHLGLSDAALGLALLGAPLGALAALAVAGRALARFGSRRIVRVCLLGYCVAGPLVGLAGSVAGLLAALAAWGAFQGGLDVSMNTQAVAAERAAGRPLMPGFHGSWSLGTFAGAGVGALAVALGVSLSTQLLLLGVPVLVVVGWLTTRMLPDAAAVPGGAGHPPAGPRGRWLSGPVLVLGGVAFASMLCEGASADWASVYLHGPLHTPAAVAALGYSAFSLTTVAVRLSGNRLLARFPARSVLPVLATVATVGLTAGLLGNRALPAIAGFASLGVGLGLVIPTVFGAAGRLPGLNPGTAIAAVSGCGWLGFVCGPPLIGGLASATSLPLALGVLPTLTACISLATALGRGVGADPGPTITPGTHSSAVRSDNLIS